MECSYIAPLTPAVMMMREIGVPCVVSSIIAGVCPTGNGKREGRQVHDLYNRVVGHSTFEVKGKQGDKIHKSAISFLSNIPELPRSNKITTQHNTDIRLIYKISTIHKIT